MSKKFDEKGFEIIESPYICDVDFIDYSARIKEMIESGMVARYEVGKNGDGDYDDEDAIQEEIVGGISPYADVGDIAISVPVDVVKQEQKKEVETSQQEQKKEVEKELLKEEGK